MAPGFTPQKLEFAAKLKASRKAANMSQERAAREVGTSRRHWIRWESGETSPNPAYLARIASVLNDPSLAAFDPDDDEDASSMAVGRDNSRDMLESLYAAIGDALGKSADETAEVPA